ncbi:DegV family protein [Flagellatimonas centrodinii]|uniref:DegV family protein n=1 Tax=Flagellatimonas centrodinii TaxID=2806210 RepID=UPI001FEE5C8D|nr:DegV family protein [Flagellatimonas centrodinii]ULQ47869.1 DegV family protein [Flagellatimonas centrodinii]
MAEVPALRVGVVVDASCDLPPDTLRDAGLNVLPIELVLAEGIRRDTRDPEATQRFYARDLEAKGSQAEARALSAEVIRAWFGEHIAERYDYVFCLTLMQTRGTLFENASKASFAILNDVNTQRKQSDKPPFALRVVDSRTLSAGLGVLALEAADMVAAGRSPNDIRRRLDTLRDHICAYFVPGDLYYLRTRAVSRGERSVNFFTYALGSTLSVKPVILCYRGETQTLTKVRGYDRAVERVLLHLATQLRLGVLSKHVCISFGGDPARIRTLPGYQALAETVRSLDMTLHETFMSAATAINAGPSVLSVAYAGDLRPFGDRATP